MSRSRPYALHRASTAGTGVRSVVESLERRVFLSAAVADTPYLYAPHAKVEGRTLEEWSAAWWQSVFAAPVYAADGTTLLNPQLVDGDGTVAHAVPSGKGNVSFLYGGFDGQDHTRGTVDHPITIKAGTRLFMPIQNSEWSNPDTPSSESNYTQVPGNYTAAQLKHFADVQTGATIHLNATIDGHSIPEDVLFNHRETAPIFSYTLPATNNIDQVFFGEDISGRVSPVAADGYYMMLRPLSPGLHTIVFGGQSIDLSATPPQLGPSAGQITYVIKVLGDHGDDHDHDGNSGDQDSPPYGHDSNNHGASSDHKDDDVFGRAHVNVF